MRCSLAALGLALSFCVLLATISPAAAAPDTRFLHDPAVSADHIAFGYAGDLWVADRDGGHARRLTTDEGDEVRPRFSPDGKLIAFSGQYDGNTDVYVIPVDGGSPVRLTWHPDGDEVQGFTPDGSRVLFSSARHAPRRRHLQLYTASLDGNQPEQLPVPWAAEAAYSPDGSRIAYTPVPEVFRQWKNYRGGTASRIWIYTVRDHAVEEIPRPEGRCNDSDPMWIGDRVYFRSDRDGEFNLYAYDPSSKSVERLTDHADFPILNASAGDGVIIYEQAGYLHVFDPSAGTGRKLTVNATADLLELRPRFVSGPQYIRNADISPSGARAVFEFRGEIVTVPAEKGEPRNLTNSPGAHERLPAWSPDGKWIAYFSDASGEYQLCIAPQDGKGETRAFALPGAGFYDDPKWSPDSKKLSFSDNSWSLYWFDVDSGKTTKVSSERYYGPFKTLHHAWSPDSKWLAYTRNMATYFSEVYLYSLDENRSHLITDGLSDVAEPVFDTGGKYLYFFASTDAGPVRQWFAMSNEDLRITGSIYMAVLAADTPSPLAKESDEEEPAADENGEEEKGEDDGGDEDLVVVDFDGLDERILALPVATAAYVNLQPGAENQVFYLKIPEGYGGFSGGAAAELAKYDLGEREETSLLAGVSDYRVSADHEKMLVQSGGGWLIAGTGGPVDPGEGQLATAAIEVRIDPRLEWEQMFHEAWRINRDYFYDPDMHGADWPAMREKYGALLPDLAVRSDLNLLLQWLCSELTVGHHFVFGGDRLASPDQVPVGLLGADYEVVDGRYRFAKVYGGLNWNPDLRSPLTEPGVSVQPGEYLLAVNGADLRAPENLYRRFENSADKIVEITVGPNADGTGSRTVNVVPVADEGDLRNRDWVESNIRKVDEATDGRVAYVYVPNTTSLGYVYFKRYFFPQAHKEAIILDERGNAGGAVADYYIDILRRPYISHWATRYGADIRTPISYIPGPKVMLIDETAGSGGDLLPWMFRKLGVGTIIGKRTWGGLVGILGFPELMDGGFITAPNIGIWTEDGWVVENQGVPPDIDVEQWPAEVIAGHDPQLEKAIEVVMEGLRANPPSEPKRPPFPVRVRR